MNKKFNHYLTIWVIMVALFIVASVAATYIFDIDKPAFYVGAIGILLAFLGQLFCSLKVFKWDDLQKFFYNIPILRILRTGLFLTAVVGIAGMLIPRVPGWAVAGVCLLIFAFTAIAVVKASAAADIAADIDERVAVQTANIKILRTKAASLSALAQDVETKAAAKKVEEALQYSDPVSTHASFPLDARIAVGLEDLKGLLEGNADGAEVKELCLKLENLIRERNQEIKNSK